MKPFPDVEHTKVTINSIERILFHFVLFLIELEVLYHFSVAIKKKKEKKKLLPQWNNDITS